MNIFSIIIIVILILVLIWGLNNFFFKTNIVYDEMIQANSQDLTDSERIIANDKLNENNTSNFMISVWFYIDNWGKNISNEKNILFMGINQNACNIDGLSILSGISNKVEITSNSECVTGSKSGTETSISSEATKYKNLSISLDKYENNLFLDIQTYTNNSGKSTGTSSDVVITRYKISNIPVQKWNCLTLSIDTKTFDVYLDGKLINSFILHGIYKNDDDEKNIYLGNINKNPSFEGFLTRVRYEPYSINPEQAYNIYKEGIDESLLKSLFNKYSLKVSFLEYNTEKGSFTI